MAHALYHAKSSARRFGGLYTDYMELHEWLDQTKLHLPDNRHRFVLHNSFGILLAEQFFGTVLVRESDKKEVPVRTVLEKHILEDGARFIPTLEQCFTNVPHDIAAYRRALPLSQMEEEQ